MNRDVARILLIRLFGSMFFLYPVYTLYLQSRSLNLTEIMTLESVLALAIILWEVPSGVLADRFGKKQLIVFSCLVQIIVTGPMLWVRGFLPFSLIFALGGIVVASQSGAMEAYLFGALRDKQAMAKYLGYFEAAEWVGMILGSLVGGIIVAAGVSSAYVICIGLLVLAHGATLAIAWGLMPDQQARREQKETFLSILRVGSRTVFRSRPVLLIVLLSLMLGGFSEKHYLWQPYLKGLGVPLRSFGLYAVLICGVCAAGSLTTGWVARRWSRKAVVTVAGSLTVAALWGVAYSRHLSVVLPTLCFLFFQGSFLWPFFTAMLNERFSDESRATSLSCVSWIGSLARMLIRPGMGMLADRSIVWPFRLDLALAAAALAGILVVWGGLNIRRTFFSGRFGLYRKAQDGTDSMGTDA